MASTSKYISLTPQVLVEYEYTDPSNPEVIETDANDAKILLLDNTYTGTTFLFNEDNPSVETGNYRNKSAIPVNNDRTQYAYLTRSNIVNYLDADDNLDSVNNLLNQLTGLPNVPTKSPHYDTIKVHLVSGFSFEELGDGFIFEVTVRDRGGRKHNLASIVYRSSDGFETNNPSPFISNERLFTNYIELKVPSLAWLTDEYVADRDDITSLSSLLTNESGFNVQGTIEVGLRYITSTTEINGQTYFTPGETNSASLNKRDEFSGLAAVIEPATNGDFFEVYGSYNGDIYEDFIIEENNKPDTDLVVVHDIFVTEQVGGTFVQTSEQSYVQTDGFDSTYKFRPIILNSHIATSYRINYVLRILNKVDNSQIIRRSQYASFDVKKYGRKLRKLNLGTVPNVTKVYNSTPEETQNIVLNNDIQFTVDGTKVIKQSEFVLGFKDNIKVSASLSTVKTQPSVNQEGDIQATAQGEEVQPGDVPLEIKTTTPTNKIYQQGEGQLKVSPFDDFVKFVFYDNSVQEATNSSEPQLMDLTQVGTLYLSFIDESGDEVRIPNFTNVKNTSPAQGEVIFRISKEDSRKILKYSSNNFYVSSRLEIGPDKSDETMMYTGKWYKPDESVQKTASDTIKTLKERADNAKKTLEAEKEASEEIIRDLEKEISDLRKEKNILEDRVSELNVDVTELLANARQVDFVAQKNNLLKNKFNSPKLKLIKNKVKQGKGRFVSPKSYEKLKGSNIKNFKINP